MKFFRSLINFFLALSVVALISYTVMIFEEALTGNDCGYISFFAFLLSSLLSNFVIIMLIFFSFKNNIYILGIINVFALVCSSYPWVAAPFVVSINKTLEIVFLSFLVIVGIVNIYLFKNKYKEN